MNILIINDFLFSSKSNKYFPFLEIFDYIRIRDNKIKLIPLILFKENIEDINSLDIQSFIQKDIDSSTRKIQNKWKNFLLSLLKGYPFFLFKKLIENKRKNMIVHLVSGFLPIFCGSIICKILNLPCIVGPNAIPSKNLIFKPIFKLNNFNFFIRDLIISSLPYNKMICFSKYQQKILRRKFKIRHEKINLVGIGINRHFFYNLHEVNLKISLFNNELKTILYVGADKEEKGFNQFIRICKSLLENNIKINILIIGIKNDKSINKLKREFENWKGNIKIMKWISRLKLINYYNLADLYINPSIDETWSMTTIEALSCGTPCICSKIPIFKKHIIENYNGLLFNINDDQDLVSKIKKGLKINWDRKNISINTLKKYDWNIQAEKMIKIYNNYIQ